VAYSAEIDVKVRNLGSINQLEQKLSSISKSVNAINKKRLGGGASGGGGGGGSSANPDKEELAVLKLRNTALTQVNRGLRAQNKLKGEGLKLEQAIKDLEGIGSKSNFDDLDATRKEIEENKKILIQTEERLIDEKRITTEVEKRAKFLKGAPTGFKADQFGPQQAPTKGAGQAAMSIDTRTKQSDKRLAVELKLRELEAKGVNTAKLRGKMGELVDAQNRKAFGDIKQINREIGRGIAKEQSKLKILQLQNKQRAEEIKSSAKMEAIRQGNFAGSGPGVFGPQPRKSFRERIGATRGFDTQSALISGAFPLLFGQGPIGAVAGGLGGGIGGMFGTMGGFAGGIAATALVQQIQSAISAIGELGRALGPFARDTKAVTSALGLQGSAQEAQLQLIEQTQGKTAAFNAAMNFMATQIGQEGVNSLKRFGENSRRITASLTLATTKFQAFGASLLNFILRISGAEKQLRKAEQERTISFAASRGDETAKSILAEQKRIDALPSETVIVPTPGPFGGIVGIPKEIRSKEAKDAQEVLDKRRALFTVRENERINLAKINSEQGAHVQTLEEEFALVNRVNELVKEGNEKGLAQKLAKNEQINKKAIENINIRQDEVKRELEGLDKIKNKNDEQKLAVDELKEKQKFLTEELEKQPGILDDMNDKTKSLHSEVDKVTEAFKELSVTIGEDIKNGIKGLIKGTSTLSDLLNNVADKFLDVALNQALFGDILGSSGPKKGGLLGFLGFADGGRPPVNRPSIVGEKGPELFVPSRSGKIIPNNKLGSGGNTSVTVNVDASGSSVEGDESNSEQLGRLIGAAIQAELIKEKRPGGLLS
jgi:hypothetical protein